MAMKVYMCPSLLVDTAFCKGQPAMTALLEFIVNLLNHSSRDRLVPLMHHAIHER